MHSQKHLPLVAIIGNIGVGKSSVLDQFRKHKNNWTLVNEPVDEWVETGLLQGFYDDPPSMAMVFQCAAFVSRILRLKQTTPIPGSCGILSDNHIVVDRHVFAPSTLATTPNAMKAYNYMCNKWQEIVPESSLDAVVYLRSSPEICKLHIAQRSRPEENTVGMEYLTKLHNCFEQIAEKHEDHFGSCCDFYTLDVGDKSQTEVYQAVRAICESTIQ